MESLAAIVGLICNFKAGRDSKGQEEFNEFIEWLIHHKHQKVVDELESNYQLNLSIKVLLNRNHDEVISTLNELNNSLVDLTSRIDGLRDISSNYSSRKFSEQAKSIIKQLFVSGGTSFLEQIHLNGVNYPITGMGTEIKPSEQRHMVEDLNLLAEMGLLRIQFIGNNTRLFHITRVGEEYAQNEL